MRFFYYGKDGGYESTVWGFWLFEIKSLCSIVLLRFEPGSRNSYHSHAFNSVSWLLRGRLVEAHLGLGGTVHSPGWRPIVTRRTTFHKVVSLGRSWVLSFRGPWSPTWREYLPGTDRHIVLTDGRVVQEVA